MLYLAFELNLSLSNSPYPKKNISFEQHKFLSVYIKGLTSTYLNKYSLRIYNVHETVIVTEHSFHPPG